MTTTKKNPPMPLEIALEFVRSTMEPYNGSWSGEWPWEQPDDDDLAIVSGIYGFPPDSFSVREIIGDPVSPGDEVEIAKRADDLLSLVNLANRLWGDREDEADTNFGYLNFTHSPDTSNILASKEFHVPFAKMSLFDQVRYRFAMMFINGPSAGHNWACDFLEELGYRYYNLAVNPVVWEGHDCDRDLSTFLDEVVRRGYALQAQLWYYEAGTGNFSNEYTEETMEWLIEQDTTSPLFPQEFWDNGDNKANEIMELFAYAVEYIQEAWEDDDLQLGSGAPKPILDWMIASGIEPSEIKKTVWDAIRDGSLLDEAA